MNNWNQIKEKSLRNETLTQAEAHQILNSTDDELMGLVDAAREVRERFFGKEVKLNHLVNVKSGICPEDCHYCSQSKDSKAPIPKYPMMSSQEIIESVKAGMAAGAKRACLVGSGRGPSEKELDDFCGAVKDLKKEHPEMEVCACLGLLMNGQAEKLKESGVYAYNHNINTSKTHYERICGTHEYDDRVDTVKKAQRTGLQACSGVLVGMGERIDDTIEMAFALRDQKVESIPVNFLVSIDKTPLAHHDELTPQKCLRVLCLMRLINPTCEIRIAGGREINLRSLQPLGLMVANSIFIGDYLTTKGQVGRADLQMIKDLGYKVKGQPADFLDHVLDKNKPVLRKEKLEETVS